MSNVEQNVIVSHHFSSQKSLKNEFFLSQITNGHFFDWNFRSKKIAESDQLVSWHFFQSLQGVWKSQNKVSFNTAVALQNTTFLGDFQALCIENSKIYETHNIEFRLCHLRSSRISPWEISYSIPSENWVSCHHGFGIIGRKLVCGNFHTATAALLPVFLGLLNLMSKLAAASFLVCRTTLKIMVTSLTLHFLFSSNITTVLRSSLNHKVGQGSRKNRKMSLSK